MMNKQEFAESEYKHLIKMVIEWIPYILFWNGAMQAKYSDDERLSYVGYRPYLMTFYWTKGYSSSLDINIEPDDLKYRLTVGGDSPGVCRIISANSDLYREYGSDFVVSLTIGIEDAILRLLPKIKQGNSFRYCASPIHIGSMPEIVHPFGDKWLCHDCIDRFSLNAPDKEINNNGKKEANTERSKMTATLRYSILERDNFSCRICGRSPLKGDDIKLHVDHIIPVKYGGKTEPGNLQTLCQDDNLGKGTSTNEQLSLSL